MWPILHHQKATAESGLNGIEVIAKIKNRESLRILAVIMQTAAATSVQIREGIDAGAFYYLTKPFSKEVLLAIVGAALRDFSKYRSLQEEVVLQSGIFRGLDSAQFHFQTLEEARLLALHLSNACPDPGRVVMGLTDLLVNAVEHGNLQVSYDEKTRLQQDGNWEEEIARRLTLPEFAERKGIIGFHRGTDKIEFTIIDQGPGFDWKRYWDMSPSLGFASHWRSIALARAMSFDIMEYRGVGNEVVCTVNIQQELGKVSEGTNPDFQLSERP